MKTLIITTSLTLAAGAALFIANLVETNDAGRAENTHVDTHLGGDVPNYIQSAYALRFSNYA